jgi:hypothetical protein
MGHKKFFNVHSHVFIFYDDDAWSHHEEDKYSDKSSENKSIFFGPLSTEQKRCQAKQHKTRDHQKGQKPYFKREKN